MDESNQRGLSKFNWLSLTSGSQKSVGWIRRSRNPLLQHKSRWRITAAPNPPYRCFSLQISPLSDFLRRPFNKVGLISFVTTLVACSGDVKPSDKFPLSVNVSGLAQGSFLLINDKDSDNLLISVNGHYQFSNLISSGENYSTQVKSQPDGQLCTVTNGSGVGSENMVAVNVTCSTLDNAYVIGGTLSGLDLNSQITLNNGGENLLLDLNGPFTFKTPMPNGAHYNVTIIDDLPFLQDCSIKNGTGTVQNAPVRNVLVSCSAAPVTVLYSFPPSAANYFPVGLLQAKDGTFYGTATSIHLSSHAINHMTGYIFTMKNGVVTTPDHQCDTPDSWCFGGAGRYWNQPPVFPTGIMQAKDGNLYGTSFLAETTDAKFSFGGATFKLDTTLKKLRKNDYFFPVASNSGPITDLIQDDDGNFYGMTYGNTYVGSTNYGGSIFKRSSDGAEIDCPDGTKDKVCTLYTFGLTDTKNGFHPNGRLALVKNNRAGGSFLYGVTEQGGANGKGVIFRFDIATLTLDVIASFDDTGTFPPQLIKLGEMFFYNPYERPYSGLTQAPDGNLYGVTKYGGKNDAGRIFKVTPPNTASLIYEFEKNNGYPVFELVQLKDGNLYGVTRGETQSETGSLTNLGSIFRIKPDGTSFTVLHSFADDAKQGGGTLPSTRLVEGSDGKSLYGATQSGGRFNQGAIYKFGIN